jgi:hypothetical protein
VSVFDLDAPALEFSLALNAALSVTASLALWLCVSEFEYADVSVVAWLKLVTSLSVLVFVVLFVFE